MVKAFFWGFAILLAINGVWLISLQTKAFPMPGLIAVQIAPLFAAITSSYLAPKKKVFIGISMALPATLISTFVIIYPQFFGKLIYFSGLKGGLIFAEITFFYCAVLCLLGGALGNFMAKRKRNST